MTQIHETTFLPKTVARHFDTPPDETNPPTMQATQVRPPSQEGIFPVEPVLQSRAAVSDVAQELMDVGLEGQAAPFTALLASDTEGDIGVPSGMNGALEGLAQRGVVKTITQNVISDVGFISNENVPTPKPPPTLTDEIFAAGFTPPGPTSTRLGRFAGRLAKPRRSTVD
ncbi:MAG: hypothetical protein WBP26_05250 [Candidatus Saccharimonadales bacterium]